MSRMSGTGEGTPALVGPPSIVLVAITNEWVVEEEEEKDEVVQGEDWR